MIYFFVLFDEHNMARNSLFLVQIDQALIFYRIRRSHVPLLTPLRIHVGVNINKF